jgi:hypothetical protein
MSDQLLEWIPSRFGVSAQLGLACFAGLGWAIWLARNKMCMQKTYPDNTIDVIYSAHAFIQRWGALMKPLEKDSLEMLVTSIMSYTRGFKSMESNPSDVGFI